MNFVGHIHLARLVLGRDGGATVGGYPDAGFGRGEADPTRFLVGAALPDIAAMGRFRLTDRPDDPAVGRGVDLHHRTDDAFHRHPWFRKNSKAVADRLEAVGLPRGAARACGHVGVELLLDGRLLETNPDLHGSVQGAIGRLGGRDLGLTVVVDDAHRTDWSAHLESVANWTLPGDYRQPAAVAERLRRILARRPRLAFGPHHLESLRETLSDRQPILEADSDAMVAEVRDSLAV